MQNFMFFFTMVHRLYMFESLNFKRCKLSTDEDNSWLVGDVITSCWWSFLLVLAKKSKWKTRMTPNG